MSITNYIQNPQFIEDNTVWYTLWSGGGDDTNTATLIESYSNAYVRDHCMQLVKTVTGTIGVYQVIYFGYDLEGLTFNIGGWIKIPTCDVGGGIELSYIWYDSDGAQIGAEVSIDTMSTVQNYTLSSTSIATAPANAYTLLYYFKVTGGALNVTAYLGFSYVYPPKSYGLDVSDGSSSSFLIPDISTIVASGTTSLGNSLNTDGTYGVNIDLPVLADINSDDIGVICQVRDFDWSTKLSVLGSFGAAPDYWGCFYGDSGTVLDPVTYYEKNDETGTMLPWTAGAMTPGDQTKWNPLATIGLLAGWDKQSIETSLVRLYAYPLYTFFYFLSAGTAEQTVVSTIYARSSYISVNSTAGYTLDVVEGNAEVYNKIVSQDWDYSVFWKGPKIKHNVSIIHIDGSETVLGTGVGVTNLDGAFGFTQDTIYTTTWSCPETVLASTDSIKIVTNLAGSFLGGYVWAGLHWYFWDFDTTFITSRLNWVKLNASTWTFTDCFGFTGQETTQSGFIWAGIRWGTASKQFKIAGVSHNIAHDTVSGQVKKVHSIGSKGVSEIDYVVYMKNYQGQS